MRLHYRIFTHPSIVSLLRIMGTYDHTQVIMEYCPEGDFISNITERSVCGRSYRCQECISSNPGSRFPLPQARTLPQDFSIPEDHGLYLDPGYWLLTDYYVIFCANFLMNRYNQWMDESIAFGKHLWPLLEKLLSDSRSPTKVTYRFRRWRQVNRASMRIYPC